MSENQRFGPVFSKVEEILNSDARTARKATSAAVRYIGEVPLEELEEFQQLREIILETCPPTPISFTTT